MFSSWYKLSQNSSMRSKLISGSFTWGGERKIHSLIVIDSYRLARIGKCNLAPHLGNTPSKGSKKDAHIHMSPSYPIYLDQDPEYLRSPRNS